MAKKNLKVDLFIVDPQNDFIGEDNGKPLKEGSETATLAVQGAVSDMRRAATLIARVGRKLNDVHVTLDSHHTMHVAHPDMWMDGNGKVPGPFTIIKAGDVESGIWKPRNPTHRQRLLQYVRDLESSGQYLHMIWPIHCRIGTWGHNVQRDLQEALTAWEKENLGVVDYVTKGSSVWTEHFGGLMAQVPDPQDPSTQLNAPLLRMLQDTDMIGILGEASSHCVLQTVKQVADNIGDENVKKMVLITDCMSPVPQSPGGPDFPAIAAQFLKDMKKRGMTLMKSDEFLA